MSEELRPCPFCVSEAGLPTNLDGTPVDYEVTDCTCKNDDCPISEYWIPIKIWQSRPIEDELRKRIAELESAQRWIPVSERLPEANKRILVIDEDGYMGVAWMPKPIAGDSLPKFYGFEGVTHWMPLPQPPEVQE